LNSQPAQSSGLFAFNVEIKTAAALKTAGRLTKKNFQSFLAVDIAVPA
jgi:hypothetical protein